MDWAEDQKIRSGLQGLSDRQFYQQQPALRPFDNGEGVWTAGANRDVEMDEFLAYGRKALQKDGVQQADETLAFEKASADLLAILLKGGASFARYTMANVLDRKVAARFLEQGGKQFYLIAFPRGVEKKFPEWRQNEDVCHRHSRLAVDPEGNIEITKAKTEWIKKEGKWKQPCFIKKTSFDPKRKQGEDYVPVKEEKVLSFSNKISQTVGPRDSSPTHSSWLAWDLQKIASENYWEVYPNKSDEENDFFWRLSVLSEYLLIQSAAP